MSIPLISRRQIPAAAAVGLVAAFGASQAAASPIAASGPGRALGIHAAPAAQQIKKLSTSVDPETGDWTSAIEFRAPQPAADATRFNVSLKPVDAGLIATWTGRTDPGDLGLVYNPVSAPFPAGAAPTPAASFNAERTVLALKIGDPHVIGSSPDYVRAVLTSPDGNSQLSEARAFLGPVAPRVSVPRSAAHLVVSRSRVLKVPLAPLSTPAARRIYVYSGDGHRVGARTLSAKYSRRASVTIRVTTTSLRHISRRSRSARLEVQNSLENGSVATKTQTVKLRRR